MMATQSNNYPMKGLRFEPMQITILKYLTGLTETENSLLRQY